MAEFLSYSKQGRVSIHHTQNTLSRLNESVKWSSISDIASLQSLPIHVSLKRLKI